MAVLEETPPNTVLDFRSDSPAITTKEQIISDRDANVSVQTVKCSKCDRPFTLERIQKHEQICNKVKERKAYDIVQMRVKGTDTEALVKAGKNSDFVFSREKCGYSFWRENSGIFYDVRRETFPLLQSSTEHELSMGG